MNRSTTPETGDHINKASPVGDVLSKLEILLQEERACLDAGSMEKLESFANRKMQLLVQLKRLSSDPHRTNQIRDNKNDLSRVREMVSENMRKLAFRIKAIGEIAETIETAFRDADSDGTYQIGNTSGWGRR